MANPHTPGTEAYKLYQYALSKNLSDKAAVVFTETMRGRGQFDTSGGTAVPATLPKHSGAARGSVASR